MHCAWCQTQVQDEHLRLIKYMNNIGVGFSVKLCPKYTSRVAPTNSHTHMLVGAISGLGPLVSSHDQRPISYWTLYWLVVIIRRLKIEQIFLVVLIDWKCTASVDD
jgi:hypothetical protein